MLSLHFSYPVKTLSKKDFAKMCKLVHLFGVWAEEGFILRKKTFGQECQKGILGVLRKDWVINFFRRTSRISDPFRTLGRKTRISDFFPSELRKLHFSWPLNILKGNILPKKQSCWFYRSLISEKLWFQQNNFDRIVKIVFCVPRRTIWRKIFPMELKVSRSK